MADATANTFGGLCKLLEQEIGRTQTDAIMDQLAMDARQMMLDRTAQGIDCEGVSFQGYSRKPIYISRSHRPAPTGGIPTPRARFTKEGVFHFSAKTGRRVQGPKSKAGKSMFFPAGYEQFHGAFSTSYPNLQATGKMLQALVFRQIDKGRVLFFATDAENDKASGHVMGDNKRLPKRDFFSKFTPNEESQLSKLWEAYSHA